MKTIIFACVHNAGRSQMAAAWFNAMADPDRARAVSASTQPGQSVHPEVLEAMREVGIDLSDAKPRLLTDELASGADMLITMGCGDACQAVPGLERDDWPLPDPKGQPTARVRRSATRSEPACGDCSQNRPVTGSRFSRLDAAAGIDPFRPIRDDEMLHR